MRATKDGFNKPPPTATIPISLAVPTMPKNFEFAKQASEIQSKEKSTLEVPNDNDKTKENIVADQQRVKDAVDEFKSMNPKPKFTFKTKRVTIQCKDQLFQGNAVCIAGKINYIVIIDLNELQF